MKQWMLNLEGSQTSRSDRCPTESFKENFLSLSLLSENHKNPIQKLKLNKSQLRPSQKFNRVLKQKQNNLRLSMILTASQPSVLDKAFKSNRSEYQPSHSQHIQKKQKLHPFYLNYNQVHKKLQKNQKDIQYLKLKIEKQENGPSKLLLSLQEVQDVYKIIADVKNINNQSTRKTSQSILSMKSAIEDMRDKIQRLNKFWQVNWQKILSSVKQNDNKIQSLIRKCNNMKEGKEISIAELALQMDKLRNQIDDIKNRDFETKQDNCFFSLFPNLLKQTHISTQPIKAELQINKKIKIGKEEQTNQFVYYVDQKGFLLDENKLYLVDCKSRLVKISEMELKQLGKICRIVES